MKQNLFDHLSSALAGMKNGPLPLQKWVKRYAEEDGGPSGDVESRLRSQILSGPNDPVREVLHRHLSAWDYQEEPGWAAGTGPNSSERRSRIYERLALGRSLRETLEAHLPHYAGQKQTLIEEIQAKQAWYSDWLRTGHSFYWSHLKTYLEVKRNLHPDSVSSIDRATARILCRLGDPSAQQPHRCRGLVVGYVQSGKTTNFTALIAKAIDAGYRLILVLSGTTNLLRNQTQRRLDLELVGVENIQRASVDHEYLTDAAWPKQFISYGRQPSLSQSVDIVRLTGQEDFNSPDTGLNPFDFDFQKPCKELPLFARENLSRTGVRLLVVKKQRDRLDALLRDLKSLGASATDEIPTLVIDDESDQASINTFDTRLKDGQHNSGADRQTENERTRINLLVVSLLSILKRAQYVGYTATPFANVLVDPTDPEDIYPKDFILSLERPNGYMGVREFHDLGPTCSGRMKNEEAYVRDIPKPGEEEGDRLDEALDAFVLTGALKIFRQHSGNASFRHHTMLVHESHLQSKHQKTVDRLRLIWRTAGYNRPGQPLERLEVLLETDFRRVWLDRGKALGLAFPRNFKALRPFLGEALDRIRADGDPVLMVNSAEGNDVPDFDRKQVWKVIVGGSKLSRGYTVEGLTISSFRRRSRTQDTLLQMGRWFGFREGYEDLVRLYIGRREPDGKTSTLDLYRAFEAICRDEEDFRAQLSTYELQPDGSPGLTPRQVPALVYNSHPRLRPTAKNRMFNATLVSAGFDYREPTRQAVGSEERRLNADLFGRLLSGGKVATAHVRLKLPRVAEFDVRWVEVKNSEVVSTLNQVEWEDRERELEAETAFLGSKECPVDSWLVVAPQIASLDRPWMCGDLSFSCVTRTRHATRFGVFSTPDHVDLAKWLVGDKEIKVTAKDLSPARRIGVLLLYPTRVRSGEPEGLEPVMGFALCLPRTKQSGRLIYRVKRPGEAVIVSSGAPSRRLAPRMRGSNGPTPTQDKSRQSHRNRD